MRKISKNLLFSLTPLLIIVFVLEISLRIFGGFPYGIYNIIFMGEYGLYPEKVDFVNYMGVASYRIKTNSYGMRSREIFFEKPQNTLRIACLGDSCTDGFYVDNKDTYPQFLENILNDQQDKLGRKSVEVLNGARGGGSIIGNDSWSKESAGHFTKLVRLIAPLRPDLVIMLFVVNDLNELRGKPGNKGEARRIAASYQGSLVKYQEPWLEKLRNDFFAKTAIGECLVSIKQPLLYKNFKRNKAGKLDASRYDYIQGGNNFAENVRIFWRKYGRTDGQIMKEPFTQETYKAIDDYWYCLKVMDNFCKQNGMKFLFVYLPGYPQIYEPHPSLKIQSIFKNECEKAGISFCDLTAWLRQEAQDQVINFAPVDYHYNPAGNKLIAEGIAEYVLNGGILSTKE